MNRDQKAVAIAEIASNIDESDAIFAVDYRGISVAQIAELRTKLREADATFKVVKNSLTERAADQVGAAALKDYLAGPTALTFVRGDVATAAKAVADYARATQLLPFKGGLMDGAPLDVDQIRSLSRMPSREVLYSQLVGVVASPVTGLVRTLGALISGLAVALGQVREKKESGEIPAGAPPAAETPAEELAAEAPPAEEPAGEVAPQPEEPAGEVAPQPEEPAGEAAPQAEEPAGEVAPQPEEPAGEVAPQPEEPAGEAAPQAEEPAGEVAPQPEEPAAEAAVEATPENKAEPEKDEPAQEDDNEADVSAEAQSEDAETNPTKED
jgi:large subunit ribosomal protein L10